MGQGDTLLNALIGAGVTVVLSFSGFSPLLGGAAAGYLQREDRREGARVGAISGALAALPFLGLMIILFGFFGLFAAGSPGGAGIMLVFGLFALLFGLAWSVGLSAVGGYLGVYVAEETDIGGAARGTT
jgi:hypothetical protein